MQIFIRSPYGKMVAVDVEPEMTIGEVKKKIGAKYQIPMAEMDMCFKGRTLKDAETINEAGIKQEDMLNIRKPSEEAKRDEIELIVKFDDRECSSMTFKLSDTIKEVKAKTFDKLHVKPKDAFILYRGQRLEDCYTIEKANIKEGDTVLLMITYRFAGSG